MGGSDAGGRRLRNPVTAHEPPARLNIAPVPASVCASGNTAAPFPPPVKAPTTENAVSFWRVGQVFCPVERDPME